MSGKIVVLVNPNRLQPGTPPVALEYLACELERSGADVRILDLCNVKNPRKAVADFFREVSPHMVGITLRNLDDVVFNIFLAGEIKPIIDAVKSAVKCPIVIGGSGFSIMPEQLLDYYGLDYGVVGEGEAALTSLLEHIDSPELYIQVPGLVYRNNGELRRNPMCCVNVRNFRLAKRGRIQYKDYVYKDGKAGTVGVQTKRGCPNNCIYCVVPNIEGRTIRLRNPREIADEMECLVDLGFKRIFLADSELNYPREHAEAVCDEFLARGFGEKLSWIGYTSPGDFDESLARKMKESGCSLLITTVDSADDALLERWNKPFRSEDITQNVKACHAAGLNATFSLTLGGPGETMDTLLKTLQFMQNLRPAKVAFGEPPGLRIYPDTPLEKLVREEGFSPSNPNLRGKIKGNESLLEPVYYLSHGMGVLVPLIQTYRKIGQLHHKLVAR